MTIIEQIKAEIERLYNGEAPKHDQQCNFDDGYFTGIDTIAQFLDTLKSEKAMEGLDEEIDRLWESFADEMEGPHNLFDIYARLARHFAQWGAEHAKIDVTDFCKPIDPGIAQCIADHSWEMLGEDERPDPSDLEKSEKPMNPDGLEKDVERWFFNEISPKINVEHSMYYYFQECARRYAQWGAEHTKNSDEKPVPNDLEEAARYYLLNEHSSPLNAVFHQADPKSEIVYHKDIENAFIAGAKWDRSQMLKEAVAVEVVGDKRDLRLIDSTQRCLFDANRGDWLKIIIVKED